MKICVIGSGYVGLVAGTCFAESGNDVICVDVDEAKIAGLKQGIIPIYEPGLKELVLRNSEEGRLSFTTDLAAAVKESLVNFIAVGTPPGDDGSADLQYVIDVARNIGRHMEGFKIIVDKSTVPVGTADKVRQAIADSWPKHMNDSAARSEWGWQPDYGIDTFFDNYFLPQIRKRYGM